MLGRRKVRKHIEALEEYFKLLEELPDSPEKDKLAGAGMIELIDAGYTTWGAMADELGVSEEILIQKYGGSK